MKVCKGGMGPRCGFVFMHNAVQMYVSLASLFTYLMPIIYLFLFEFLFVYSNNGELDVGYLDEYNDWDYTKYQDYLKRFVRIHLSRISQTI